MGGTRHRTTTARRTLALALLLFLAAGVPARAQAQERVPLRWKFKAGDALHYRMDQNSKTQVKINEQEITTTVSQVLNTTWMVKSIDDKGNALMAQTIDSIKTKIESPFAAVEYDTTSGKEPVGPIAAGVVPMIKALVGKTFQYTMTPAGELRDVKVPEGLLKALKEAGPSAPAVGMFSEEGLKNMITESSLILDAKPTWTRETKIPTPPIGTMQMTKTYRREQEKTKDGFDRISLKVNLSLDPTPDPNFTVKIADQKGGGEFIFDNDNGRVVRSHVEEHVQMDITVMKKQTTQVTDSKTDMTLVPAGKEK
jgi:hypothetical protein